MLKLEMPEWRKYWDQNYENFSPEEFNHSGLDDFYMSASFMERLQFVRSHVMKPIVVHEGFAKEGHAQNSLHYSGEAADLHIKGLSLLEMVLVFYKYSDLSIGVYPEWHRPGLHVDARDKPLFWIKGAGEYRYFLTFHELVTSMVLA